MKQRSSNLPRLYYLSLEESVHRQQFMQDQFKKYGITKVHSVISPRFKNFPEPMTGYLCHALDDGMKGCIATHLKTIKNWYLEYNEPYVFICEDDISFETAEYWNFSWSDFIRSLPLDWGCVQLHCIRESFDEITFRDRKWDDWSVGAYILTRDYAKKLIEMYCRDDGSYHVEMADPTISPLVENMIYSAGKVYCIPLLIENTSFESTFSKSPDFEEKGKKLSEGQKDHHHYSSAFVLDWWKNYGKVSNIVHMSNPELSRFIQDPENPEINFELALWYEKLGQTAAAISYFIRCADRTQDRDLACEAMLHVAICFDRQGGRHHSVKGAFQSAIVLAPRRPEPYFLLARYCERREERYEGYLVASQGLEVADFSLLPLRTDLEYPGKYGIIFEKAVCAWTRGMCDESRALFHELADHYEMDYEHTKSVQNNLITLGLPRRDPYSLYDSSKYNRLRFKFPGSETIQKNYSQCYQDMFILSVLNGKRNGRYFEIGAGPPYVTSNTALLEEFGWTGASIDIKESVIDEFKRYRKNPVFLHNAVTVNYKKLFKEIGLERDSDYLQLDCEPPNNTFESLLNMPLDEYRFAVITYEHDYYQDVTKSYRDKSRRYLKLLGYELLVSDVSVTDYASFEDWWVHPELVNRETIDKMRSVTGKIQKAERYMLVI